MQDPDGWELEDLVEAAEIRLSEMGEAMAKTIERTLASQLFHSIEDRLPSSSALLNRVTKLEAVAWPPPYGGDMIETSFRAAVKEHRELGWRAMMTITREHVLNAEPERAERSDHGE